VPFLDAVSSAVRPLGPFRTGLDVCCGTGAAVGVLRELCEEGVTGVDFSAGMLAEAAAAFPPAGEGPLVEWVRADARSLPFRERFDLATSFGAFGHFLPAERPAVFAGVRAALRPGGLFVFPLPAPPRVGSLPYWALWGFDAAMRVRNAVWWPRFVMYYRTLRLADVQTELADAGFTVELLPATALGTRKDGSPRCVTVVARRP
jgi:SAM-dependent methyltransferase